MRIARLNADGTLLSLEDHAGSAPPADAVEVAAACDLLPGRYRWDGKAFLPVAPELPLRPDDRKRTLDAHRALYALCQMLQQQGMILPMATTQWMQRYGRTLS